MLVWNIFDVIGLALWILIILVFIIVCLVVLIKDKLHNIFKKNKTKKGSGDYVAK